MIEVSTVVAWGEKADIYNPSQWGEKKKRWVFSASLLQTKLRPTEAFYFAHPLSIQAPFQSTTKYCLATMPHILFFKIHLCISNWTQSKCCLNITLFFCTSCKVDHPNTRSPTLSYSDVDLPSKNFNVKVAIHFCTRGPAVLFWTPALVQPQLRNHLSWE